MQDSIQFLWARIHAWLKNHAAEELALFAPPAADSAIDALDGEIPTPLPRALRDSARIHNGQHGGAIAGLQLLSLEEGASERERMLGYSTDDAVGFDWSPNWFPVLTDGGGDYYFIDLATGAVHEWNHELASSTSVAPSFEALLTWYANALEAGDYEASEEGLIHKELGGPGGLCWERPDILEQLLRSKLPLSPSLWAELEQISRADLLARIDEVLATTTEWPTRNHAALLRAWLTGPSGAAWGESLWANGKDITFDTRAYVASKCFAVERALSVVLSQVELLLNSPRLTEALSALSILGTPQLIEWCERHVASPVAREWGLVAAAAHVPWSALERWLAMGRPHSLMALDALLYGQPGGREAAGKRGFSPRYPQTPEAISLGIQDQPSKKSLLRVLDELQTKDSNPRMTKTIDAIRDALRG